MPDKVCRHCGTTFRVRAYRTETAKFCSHKCQTDHTRGGFVDCMVCGKPHYRPKSHMEYEHLTCSLKCRGVAKRLKNPGYATSIGSVRKWMRRRGLMGQCSRCGYDDHPEILTIHHRDRNSHNQKVKNLEVLCPNCHALEHLSEQKSGWDHTSNKRRRVRRAA